MKQRPWLLFALITTLFWGVWGALIEIPEKAGFPATLGYCVWALTMVPCALVGLRLIHWKLETDRRSVLYGSIIGFTGAGGQLVLFLALHEGPAYIVFPVVSLYPVVTVFLSIFYLKESATKKHWIGIVIALLAIIFLSYTKPSAQVTSGFVWLLFAVIVFLTWGIQAFIMKVSNESMKAESIFFYMALTAVLLMPFAVWMTDFTKPVNWGFKGPYLAAMIQVLNAIGALTLVYALRYGKAIIVVPLTALAPVITIVLSLFLYRIFPHPIVIVGLILAVAAMFLLAE